MHTTNRADTNCFVTGLLQGNFEDAAALMDTVVSGAIFPSSHVLVAKAMLVRSIAVMMTGNRCAFTFPPLT